MFPIIVTITEDEYSRYFCQDVSSVSPMDEKFPGLVRAVFRPEGFAPGVWCGTEGLKIRYNDNEYIIAKVNLQERELRLYKV